MGRFGSAEEVAGTVAFLLSNDAQYITGEFDRDRWWSRFRRDKKLRVRILPAKSLSETHPAAATSFGKGVTAHLADLVVEHRKGELPSDVRAIAGWCVLDTIGVALAGMDEPAASILRKEVRDNGQPFSAGLIGSSDRVSMLSAALLNGTAAHALDYDDVHMAIPGHASACIVPAVIALAEDIGASGKDVMTAVISGFEVGCRTGALLSPGHYNAGFHATGTIGAIAAAGACAGLLGLDAEGIAHALGIAAGQAAGLKSMMGTMCKPLNAGRAAYNGLLSARLASRGFVSRPDILECEQGFGATHGPDFNVGAAISSPAEGFYLRTNIFKFHASCVLTHAPIEALRALLLNRQFVPSNVAGIVIRIDRVAD